MRGTARMAPRVGSRPSAAGRLHRTMRRVLSGSPTAHGRSRPSLRGCFWSYKFICKLFYVIDLHPAGLEPATL
jgi:hypothetical protein